MYPLAVFLKETSDTGAHMKVVTAQEMRKIDRVTIEKYGIQSLILMERAGLVVASRVMELFGQKTDHGSRNTEHRLSDTDNKQDYGRRIVVLCGSGNNGGDGIVAARNLHNWGFKVNVLIFAKEDLLTPDCNTQYQIAKKIGVSQEFRTSLNKRDIHGAIVIDAIFGTGLSRPVKGEIANIFTVLKNSEVPVISVDIPSGVSANTGEILGGSIMADITVTFGLPKRGHFLYPGAKYTGRLLVEDIGFPARLLLSDELKVELIDRRLVSDLIPPRQKYSHKGNYGHVLIIAGSKGKTGAAFMAARACLRSGAGLVTLAVPESLMDVFQSRVTEEMTLSLPDDGKGALSEKALKEILNFTNKGVDVIAIGPGIGISSDTERIMSVLVQKSTVPMVVDADGINSLSRLMGKGQEINDILKKAKSPIILTPHVGEMARLLQKSEVRNQKSEENPPMPPFSKVGRGGIAGAIQEIEKDRINTAISFSKETGTYIILKGVPTIVAEPGGNAFINTTGNPGMASAGSGDVLTGAIASLLGQGMTPLNSCVLGAYLHGAAGDMAAKLKGEHSLVASDIIEFLPDAICSVINDER